MKYRVNTQFRFEGYIDVDARDAVEAEEIIAESFGLGNYEVAPTDTRITNWNFPMHPDKVITSIKKK